MNNVLRRSAVVLLLMAAISARAGAREQLVVRLTLDREPAKGLTLTYRDVTRTLRARTDARGVARFDVSFAPGRVLPPHSLELELPDFVLVNLRGGDFAWTAEAARSATWQMRKTPRVCDEWLRVIDIPRGGLRSQSAAELETWYRSLTPRHLANCETLARIERQVGSKAPWYFYEFKAMPAACDDGRYTQELDWTLWYRRLLEEATGASPGKCLSDWERWWAAKGYPPIPGQPSD